MSTQHHSGQPELAALYTECVSLGYGSGTHFFIAGVSQASDGDVIGIGRDGSQYTIWAEDRGHRIELLRTEDFAPAREYFLKNVGWHAGHYGIGPYAGRNRLEEEGWTKLSPRERDIRWHREKGVPIPDYLLEESDDESRVEEA